MEVYVDDDSKLTLHGLQQHYVKLKDNEKNRKLFELLDALEFNQVICHRSTGSGDSIDNLSPRGSETICSPPMAV